ncbi:1-phosphatidylinositol-4 [Perilla frutescens var. hirtella]|uniref:1-phosphatidylinositol-4 n=1 Tax=Perilla frutescens var. hirtella TaxID=608512 RepID=A0AAD4NYL8_PERFH|nr:1-phosphatidylinositol-4 [Perilla frutescens var. frutescens]KAH6819999.1 1-phosphatidylinositol-4 [Perilla frutescens var. hirtella]
MREVPRNIAWERRRRQLRRKSDENLTDEDLNELKGCIELGFGFNAEEGQRLCTTIPALDLYFAVNRQFLTSPLTSPGSGGSARPPPPFGSPDHMPPKSLSLRSCSFEKPASDSDSWKILSPGDDPQQVKTKLRHWAQAVACSVLQSPIRGGGMD